VALALSSVSSSTVLSSAIAVVLRIVGSHFQRREDVAMAGSVAGQVRCYPNSRDVTFS
jgi:hypothetical protein